MCATWLICMCDMTHLYVRHDSFVCATWLICMCTMTHLYVHHDSFIPTAWLICMCDMTHLYVRHDSFVCATWLICMCNMTHLCLRHDSFVCAAWLIYTYDMTHLHVRDTTDLYVLHGAIHTRWRRLVGCLQLQVIFCKRATNYRAFLRRMTYKDKTSYDSMPPCICDMKYLYFMCIW